MASAHCRRLETLYPFGILPSKPYSLPVKREDWWQVMVDPEAAAGVRRRKAQRRVDARHKQAEQRHRNRSASTFAPRDRPAKRGR